MERNKAVVSADQKATSEYYRLRYQSAAILLGKLDVIFAASAASLLDAMTDEASTPLDYLTALRRLGAVTLAQYSLQETVPSWLELTRRNVTAYVSLAGAGSKALETTTFFREEVIDTDAERRIERLVCPWLHTDHGDTPEDYAAAVIAGLVYIRPPKGAGSQADAA